jgi:ATP-grasp ribosomal peptide maturase
MATILVLTEAHDPHADFVIAELNRQRIPVFRFNTGDFPLAAKVSGELHAEGWDTRLFYNSRELQFRDVTSVWYRRPERFRLSETLTPAQREFAQRESRAVMAGLLASLSCVWVNHPARLAEADSKVSQLRAAQRCGLEVPRTLITNDPTTARRFYDDCDRQMIYKPITSGIVAAQIPTMVYTSAVTRDSVAQLERVRNTPAMFQELVPKAFELRITIIGTDVFAARIDSQKSEETRMDWRRGQLAALGLGEYDLPEPVRAACLSLLQQFGLLYSAIDMIVTPDGDHVFLELNPNGQWAFVELTTGLPLRDSLIRVLTGSGDRSLASERQWAVTSGG